MKTKNMILIALFAAVTVVCAQLVIPFIPVPFSLSIVAIFTCGGILDKKSAALSQVIYILLGLCGLPVFSGFSGGLQKVAGPTGGYIIAYPIMAFIVALILEKAGKKTFGFLVLAMGSGLIICYVLGSIWLAFSQKISLWQALTIGVLPFIITDLMKIALSASVVLALEKALNRGKEKIFLK